MIRFCYFYGKTFFAIPVVKIGTAFNVLFNLFLLSFHAGENNNVIFYRGSVLPMNDVFDLDSNPEVLEHSKGAWREVANEEVENESD